MEGWSSCMNVTGLIGLLRMSLGNYNRIHSAVNSHGDRDQWEAAEICSALAQNMWDRSTWVKALIKTLALNQCNET